MLLDFREHSGSPTIHADVCVIGSGAAGITLAMELDHSGLDVLVLAGGAAKFDAACQDLYRSCVVGLHHKGIHGSRARIHGGTTTLWAGQAMPLEPIDFEVRDWVPHSGWPISLETLAPYYLRAERIMKLAPFSYDEAAWPPGLEKPPAFDPDLFYARISQFARVPNFSVLYRRELTASRNVQVLLHAHAVELQTDAASSRVNRVAIQSLEGRSGHVEARFVVVCCGAIETARLLLASDRTDARGVGNTNDLVGRFFQDHIQSLAAPIQPTNRRSLCKVFGVYTHRRTRYCPRILATASTQRRHRILNICCGPTPVYSEDHAIEGAKLLVRSLWRKELRPKVPHALWKVVRNPFAVVVAATRYVLYGTPMTTHAGPLYLGLQAEQAPNPASRVILGEERDALGMRRTVLDWRLTELDHHTLTTIVKLAKMEYRRIGVGEVGDFDLPDDLAKLDRKIHDCSHQIGTTRMHDDPKQGVVDRHCRVHGIDNLYIGSSAVFPTGGSSNPTLTIIALCLRIADRLKQECRASTAVFSS